ncbi:SDR family NAD(P)-dependent oxidoreductase [Microbacterium sp. B24]|uniref:SDR family NAD(P)-dependent oxidoreductase n=1 Tax=Microbacterium sp. B24 TaxID=95616 RepID=UPI0003FB30BF|nr:SDR family oxidoreductase [Microbacterium sp. B24]
MSTVVITGAARGQGAAHAAALADAGYALVLADRMDDAGQRVAAGLRERGADARYYSLDVGDEGGWSALAAQLEDEAQPVVGLVNNAGILRYGRIADTDSATWLLHDRVNALGAFLGIRALAPLMREGGSIVNVSSTAALVGTAGYAAYSASKAAVIALTRVAAIEYAPSVRVNAICPGGVDTPMNDDEPVGGSSTGAPLGRRARPEEISPLVRYLVSDASSFVTGSVLTIDGGLTAT